MAERYCPEYNNPCSPACAQYDPIAGKCVDLVQTDLLISIAGATPSYGGGPMPGYCPEYWKNCSAECAKFSLTYNKCNELVQTEMLQYIKDHPQGGGGESESVVIKVGNTANATVNLADANGLSFTALANKLYIIEAWIAWNTSATTVGIKLSASAPASPTFISGQWLTNAANGTLDGAAFNANDVTVTTAAAPFTTNNFAILYCSFFNGANQGDWKVRFAAETTGTITILGGSSLRYRQLN